MADAARQNMRLPNLFVIGVQKCGTTLLCKHLANHPDVVHSDPKEPFTLQRKIGRAGFEAYLRDVFAGASDNPDAAYLAEGSTTYFQSRRAMNNIERFCGGDVKIIAALRHPAHRAVSHYFHDVRRRPETTPKSILATPYYLERSTYAPHLRRWKRRTAEGNLLVLKYEDLRAGVDRFVGAATDFLGISKIEIGAPKRVNAGYRVHRDGDYLMVEENEDFMLRLDEVHRLHDSLADDIKRTGRMAGFDVSDWLERPEWPSRP